MAICPHCDQEHQEGTDYCPRTGRPIADVATRMIGRTIAGKYRLIRNIGQGGMGTIFEAEHAVIGNRMAVKLLHEPFAASREPVQRLYREARATGAIGHPNIIKIYDVGETGEGTPFLVMELLEGESLGDHLDKNGPRPLGFALDVSIQMLSALHAAHVAGIIHRDLKSDNIFLVDSEDEQIHIKILDFGVSKFVRAEQDNLKLTQTGSVLGTPYYMSPEQASGKKDLDHRLDIYAAGVILYEMLTGVVPHRASNYNALLMEIITRDVEPFAWQRPDMPPEMEAVVLKAVTRRRDDRWQRALDFMEALVEIRDGLPASHLSVPASVVQTAGRPVNRLAPTVDVLGEMPAADEPDTPFVVEQMNAERRTADRSKTGKGKVLAISGALLGVLAGLGVVLLTSLDRDSRAQETPSAPAEPGATEDREDNASTNTSPERKRVVREGTAGEGDDTGQRVKLKVIPMPAEARITADGRPVPPDGIELAPGDDPVSIVAEADGFERQEVEFIPREDAELELSLEPIIKKKTKRTAKRAKRKRNEKKATGRRQKSETAKTSVGTINKNEPAVGKGSLDRPMDNPF